MRRLALLAIVVAAMAIGFGGSASASSAAVAATPCVASGEAAAQQQAGHRAGLVIVLPDRVETFCIEFAGDSITGSELLEQSGLPIVFAGFGGLGGGVCRIEDVGCSDPGDCFCQCQGAECSYWSYFVLEGEAWAYENVGPSQRRLRDGDVDGWVWGSGDDAPAAARGPCPATPTATIASPPSATPVSTPAASSGPGAVGQSATAPASQPTATNTLVPQSTSEVRARETAAARTGGAASTDTETDGGVPAGLIWFGVVAGVLIAGTGGLLAWRRLRG
jgi:hypothetical protein